MRLQTHTISTPHSSTSYRLTSYHFGQRAAGKKVYIQAGLHADEVPGMLLAQRLRATLAAEEAAGTLSGEVVLVPVANPIGLGQALQGTAFGRFDFSTGVNFNRGFKHVADTLKRSLTGQLGPNLAHNTALVRAHALAAVADWQCENDAQAMKKILLGLAIDADLVLDLHCDNEAVLHLYAGTPLAEAVAPLAALLGARAVLLALEAGQEPFDEACSRLWWELAAHFGPGVALAPACVASTVELRGETDVSDALAGADCAALLRFLRHSGVLAGETGPLPPMSCTMSPLEGVDPITAPHNGVLVYQRALGAAVAAGEVLASLVDPVTGEATSLCSRVDGVFFARRAQRHVLRGMNVGKVAGSVPFRAGNLLSQ